MVGDALRDGRQIVDIGPDFARRAAGRAPSDYYNMERRVTDGYDGYTKAFERSGPMSGGCRALISSTLSRDDIVTYSQEAFGFLEGVARRPVEIETESLRTVLVYTGGSITIEVELDWQEWAAFLLLCRTVDGRRPPGYYMHEGKRMRVHFTEALADGTDQDRVIARKLRSVARESGPDAMREQVQEFSAALHGVVDQLADYHEKLFAD